MKPTSISRRGFVKSGSVFLATLSVGPSFAYSQKIEENIRVGIIGTGSRGCGLASIIKDMPGIQILACCDILPNNLKEGMSYAAKGAKSYSDYRQLLDDKNIDAVIIATPLFLHYPMSLAAWQAGKHVYLEKSLSYDIPQTIDITNKVKNSSLVFQIGYQYRYYGLYHKVKDIIQKNWLGKVTHFECQYNRNSNWRNPVSDPKLERIINWRMYREYCGGPLSELCAHEIDMVNYLTASHPLKAVAMGNINYWKDGRDTYDSIQAIYEYPGGIQASFNSILSNAFNGYNIKIMGDKATVEILRDKAYIYAENTDTQKGIVDGVTGATIATRTQGKAVELNFKKQGEEDVDPTLFALTDFFSCIREKRKPVSNVETAMETSIAIHMGNAAADTGTQQIWKPEYSL